MGNSTISPADRKIGPSKLRASVCPWCGSDALDLGPGKGPHPASVVCSACGRFVRWVGLPIDATEAAAFVMPFGRHQGMPMGELPHDYLEWVSRTIAGRIGKRAQALLENTP